MAIAKRTNTVVDLASTIVEQYETTSEKRVLRQYLLSSCGCTGSTQGMKLDYAYTNTGGLPDIAERVAITESKLNEATGVYEPYRKQYLDFIEVGTGIPYMVTRAVQDLGSTSDIWVDRYEYDSNRNLSVHYTPSAVASYNTGSGAVTLNSTGLAYHYIYTTPDNRLRETWIKRGNSATEYLLERTGYGNPANSSERAHLVKTADRLRIVTSTPPPGDSPDVERVSYAYGFHTTGGDDVAWIETTVEAELEAENGPAGTGVTYKSYELFDLAGNNIWSRAADGALTKRTFDPGTGALLSMTQNDDGGSLPAGAPYNGIPGYGNWTSTDRNGVGGSLTTQYSVDLLGRGRDVVSPGQVHTYILREMREFPGRLGLKYYAEITLPHAFVEGQTTSYSGPATVTWHSAGDDAIGTSEFPIGSGGYENPPPGEAGYARLFADYDLVVAEQLTRMEVVHDLSGLETARREWYVIDTEAPSNDRLRTTQYFYDGLGRLVRTINANGTLTRNSYDVLDRIVKAEVGLPVSVPAGTGTDPDEGKMRDVMSYVYDGDNGSDTRGIGNGTVTRVRLHLGASGNARVTDNRYDFRDHLILVENPDKPYFEAIAYDNLDREVRRALFAPSTPTAPGSPSDEDYTGYASNRVRYTETAYSQRGLVFRQAQAIIPSAGTLTFLETHTWYDEVGRPVGNWAPNGPGNKTTYDGLGRAVTTYMTDRRGDPAPGSTGNYPAVYDSVAHVAKVDGDVVFEQTEQRFITGNAPGPHVGMSDLVTTYRRTHDATDANVGALTGPIDDDLVITTFASTYYDGADRVIRSVNLGTNKAGFEWGGTAPQEIDQSVPPQLTGTPQAWDNTDGGLVNGTRYGSRGLVEFSIDPEGREIKYVYDDLSRQIATIENFQNGAVAWNPNLVPPRWSATGVGDGGGEGDDDRITSFVFDGIDNVIVQTAHKPSAADDQVTEYRFGVAEGTVPGDSELFSQDLLRLVVFPDNNGAGEEEEDYSVFYGYNRQGERIFMQDQNGTVHEYTLDDLGRVTDDQVSAFGTNIDQAINTIQTTFDDAGRVRKVTSILGGASTAIAINDVEFSYTPLWQIENVWQEPNGVVDRNGTPPDSRKVTYEYTNADVGQGNFSRLETMTYPDGAELDYLYGASATSDHLISRMKELQLDGISGLSVVTYGYIGLGMVALVDYPDPDVQLDRSCSHIGERQYPPYDGNANTDMPGAYPGFDRFGRVARQMWVDGALTTGTPAHPNVPPIVELTHSYDKAGNRTRGDNETPTIKWPFRHQTFKYDKLDRLSESVRGVRSTVPPPEFASYHLSSQDWTLDMLGNWNPVKTNPNSSGQYQTVEPRTHNRANELLDRDPDGIGSGPTLDLTYDKAGNVRQEERLTSGGTATLVNTHDAWNRLVKVQYVTGSNTYDRGEYEYSGLNWRIVKRSDSNLTDTNNALDEERTQYYTGEWQLCHELIDDDAPLAGGTDVDRHVQNVCGQRYIDDVVLHRENTPAIETPPITYEKTFYHLTDAQFSTVAIINDAAGLVERVSYTPYGVARHHRKADLTGDGAVGINDLIELNTAYNSYGVGDLNRDGIVQIQDLLALNADYGLAEPGGAITAASYGVDNQIGYCGYVFNSETQEYLARNRWYSPVLGRWLERDPAGALYVDGSNLYEYAKGSAATLVDSFGLFSCKFIVKPLGKRAPEPGEPGDGLHTSGATRASYEIELSWSSEGCVSGCTCGTVSRCEGIVSYWWSDSSSKAHELRHVEQAREVWKRYAKPFEKSIKEGQKSAGVQCTCRPKDVQSCTNLALSRLILLMTLRFKEAARAFDCAEYGDLSPDVCDGV